MRVVHRDLSIKPTVPKIRTLEKLDASKSDEAIKSIDLLRLLKKFLLTIENPESRYQIQTCIEKLIRDGVIPYSNLQELYIATWNRKKERSDYKKLHGSIINNASGGKRTRIKKANYFKSFIKHIAIEYEDMFDIPNVHNGYKTDQFLTEKTNAKPISKEKIKLVGKRINDPQIKIMFKLQAMTGARISEILDLKLEDVDFKNQTVTQSIKKRKMDVKRERKLSKVEFNIVIDAVESTKAIYKSSGHEMNGGDNIFIYASKKQGWRKISKQQINRAYNKALKACGAKVHGQCTHVIRVSFICGLFDKGYNMEEVCNYLGHAKPEMTRHYYHLTKNMNLNLLE